MVFNCTNPPTRKDRGGLTEDRFDQVSLPLPTASMSRRHAIGMISGVFAGVVASNSFGVQRASAQPGPRPQQIYVIRHGEKPPGDVKNASDVSAGAPLGGGGAGDMNTYPFF